MKFISTQNKIYKKSWSIAKELRIKTVSRNEDTNSMGIVDAVDSDTGEYITWVVCFKYDGTLSINTDFKHRLKSNGYDPDENKVQWCNNAIKTVHEDC
jgi:hypothetical protein